VVTGATGFLGSEIVRQAAAAGRSVRGVARAAPPVPPVVPVHRADVRDPAALRAALAGAGTVIHAAALAHVFDRRRHDAALFTAVNEVGTANVVRVAAESGAGHVVLVSSVAVYGGGDDADERTACHPAGPYATSKWRAEQRATEIAASVGLPLTVLRLATVYGEGDRGNVARLVRALDRGRFVWIGDGSNRKSLIHREDAARAVLRAAERATPGAAVFNVAAPPVSMRAIVEAIAAALGRRPPPPAVPVRAARALAGALGRMTGGRGRLGALGTTLHKWLSDDAYDATRFATVFGFACRVALREGLARQVAWYRGHDAPAPVEASGG